MCTEIKFYNSSVCWDLISNLFLRPKSPKSLPDHKPKCPSSHPGDQYGQRSHHFPYQAEGPHDPALGPLGNIWIDEQWMQRWGDVHDEVRYVEEHENQNESPKNNLARSAAPPFRNNVWIQKKRGPSWTVELTYQCNVLRFILYLDIVWFPWEKAWRSQWGCSSSLCWNCVDPAALTPNWSSCPNQRHYCERWMIEKIHNFVRSVGKTSCQVKMKS